MDKVINEDVEVVYDDLPEEGENDAQQLATHNEENTDAEANGEQLEGALSSNDTEEDAPAFPGSDDADEPEDAEYASYSGGVKKRIKREIRLRKQVQAELVTTRQQAQAITDIVRNGEAAYNTITEQHEALQEQYYKLLDVSMQNAMEQKTRELQYAKEQGDTASELRAQSELDELRFNKRQLGEVVTGFSSQKAQAAQQRAQRQAQGMRLPQPQRQVPPLAIKWVERNSWIRKPEYAKHREQVGIIDAKLLAARFDPNTPEYYAELDKELRKAFPGKGAVRGKGGQSPVAPAANGSGTGRTSARRIVLTRADMDTMRKFGLDPANKEHVVAFAQQRAA